MFGWNDERFEKEMKEIEQWDIYLRFKQENEEESSLSSEAQQSFPCNPHVRDLS